VNKQSLFTAKFLKHISTYFLTNIIRNKISSFSSILVTYSFKLFATAIYFKQKFEKIDKF